MRIHIKLSCLLDYSSSTSSYYIILLRTFNAQTALLRFADHYSLYEAIESQTADFVPVRNNDEYLIFISVQNLVRTNIVLSDVTAIILPLWNTHGKHDVIHKTESTQHPSQHRRGQHARSLVKFGRMVSEICERTYRQTYSSQYSASLLGRRTNLQPLVQQIYNKSNQWSLSISGVD